MKTGIILKITGNKAVIMKSDGEFIRVTAKGSWQAGDVVAIPHTYQRPMKIFYACAASFLLLFLGGFGWNQLYLSPVALISVDVNPSIELSVNRLNMVISASALNDEGAKILLDADIQNTVYREALVNILSAESADGYLNSGSEVVLTVFSQNLKRQRELLSELQGIVNNKISSYSNKIPAEYHVVDESTVEYAHGHGVTAGKYLYLQQLQNINPQTDITEYLHHSIEQLKGEIKACKEEHGSENIGHHHHCNHNGE